MTLLDDLERRVRAQKRTIASERVGSDIVTAESVSAMINRGMATSDTVRVTWKLNGKRIGLGALRSYLESVRS